MAKSHALTVGPFGGPGHVGWNDGIHTTVKSVKIRHSTKIDSIQFEYDDNGESTGSPWHGSGPCGWKEDTVKLEPCEFLTNISGYVAICDSVFVVRSLTITSNKKKYGPYGLNHENNFSTSSTRGKIVGFFGRSGWWVDSIGAYFVPIPKEKISIGPFGGEGGKCFNDGVFKKLMQINVRHGDIVDSLQFVYETYKGVIHWSDEHGTKGGGKLDEIRFEGEDEYVISMSGYYKVLNGNTIVSSLKFKSNRNEFGPYGKEEDGKPFSTSTSHGKIIGFFGRSGANIDSIGAHFVPLA